jgi:NhaP-type Na+/H+ or K+/H+ antiporter
MIYVAVLASFVLLYGVASGKLEKTVITAPMVFTLFGLALSPFVHERLDVETEVMQTLAELTLVLVLFVDASRIDLRLLRRDHNLPFRMLLIGMPITIAVGTLAARVILAPVVGWYGAAVLAAILAPTDAALGQAVVTNKRVPVRIRQALNVESGINDGLALPAVFILASLAGGEGTEGVLYWVRFIGLQLGVGGAIGVLVGWLGGLLVSRATRSRWMNHSYQQLASIALAVSAYALAELLFGNGFIAAFCAGLTMGNLHRPICSCLYEFGEAEGQLLVLFTFTLFGAVFVPFALPAVTVPIALFVVTSLTVIRMVPVSASLLGTGLMADTHLFLGWFGPRGLASILFGLLILGKADFPGRDVVFTTIVLTVLVSVFVHGMTAVPLANSYGRRAESMTGEADMPEMAQVSEMPTRGR